MFDEIKKHPYVIGGAVLGIIVLFFLLSSGGGGTAAPSAGGESDVSAAEANNNASIMANAQIAQGNLALAGLKEQIGGAISLATIQAHTADNANELAAAVAAQQINAEAGSRDLTTTLAAQTQQRYFQMTENITASNNNTVLANTQFVTNALVRQAEISRDTTLGVANLNASVINQQTRAQENIATQSWWDSIF